MSFHALAATLILLCRFAAVAAPVPPTLSYLTSFGNPAAIATDTAGNVYVAGSTGSSKFPLMNAFRSVIGEGNCSFMPSKTFQACPEAFVAKLDPTGTRLIYSTYLGGYGRDFATSIAVDASGSAYVAGVTDSGDFPGTDAPEKKFVSARSFAAKFSPTGELIYARVFPGTGGMAIAMPARPYMTAISADQNGNAAIAGVTNALDLPTVNAVQPKPLLRPLFVTGDSGKTWRALPFPDPVTAVNGLAIDPRRTATMYAATDLGLYKSLDGGATWSVLYRDPQGAPIAVLALDLKSPDTLYIAINPVNSGPDSQSKVMKSTDAGATFRAIMQGIVPDSVWGLIPTIGALAIDPANSATLWLGVSGAMYRSTDAGEHWLRNPPGTDPLPPPIPVPGLDGFWGLVSRILVDATQPNRVFVPGRVYACCINRPGTGLYRTDDGGVTWTQGGTGPVAGSSGPMAPALDPRNGNVLFAPWYHGLARTTDAGATWQEVALPQEYLPDKFVESAFDVNGALYVLSNTGLVLRSADNALTWTATYGPWSGGNSAGARLAAFQPGDPSTFYVSARTTPRSAFVAKLDPAGRLLWTSYLGGSQSDEARAVAFDPSGDVWVAGTTSSKDFPTVNAVQPVHAKALTGDMAGSDAFVTKIAADGSRILYSTFLGGPGDDAVNALAVDAQGNVYAGGVGGISLPSTGQQPTSYMASFTVKLDRTGRIVQAANLDTSNSGNGVASMAVAPDGSLSVAGCSAGAGLPLVNALDPIGPGSFLATLAPSGQAVEFGSYFFPCFSNYPPASPVLARAPSGSLWVAGPSTQNVTQIGPDLGAPAEGYLARIDFTPAPASVPVIRAVRNAAGYQLGEVFANGSLGSIFGYNLARTIEAARATPLPLEMGGVSIMIGRTAAPLLYVSPTQVNFQFPFELGMGDTTLDFQIDGQTVLSRQVRIVAIAPGFFTQSGDGRGPGIVVHASDFRLVTRDNPATAGEILALYATGLGRGEKQVRTGETAAMEPNPAAHADLFSLAADSRGQTILYAGLAPGMVGVYQINFVFDPTPGPGEKELTFYGSNSVTVFAR